ncbi:MAG TPA: pyridoxal-dependent decarboxylase, partial [Gaiellaceae bacterium]|nr:pyridoxal-dependent decarboxylase [Gaiellaceae bacterium]
MDDLRELFELTAALAADFYETLPDRPVYPRATVAELHAALSAPLPERGLPARTVIAELAAAADPGLVAEASGRYFGFVIGGAVPASIAADWLTSTWDQNAGLFVGGPSASIVEQVAGAWLIELLGLPRHASFGFVTGGQMATFTALAAARHHVLARVGWDVERDGLQGAPKIRVIVGAKRHGTVDRALRMLGLGTPTELVPADSEGRMLAGELRIGDEPTIVCAQAGEVNTGASDPFHAIADARDAAPNAWIHVDGAFGLWAAATETRRHLVDGAERADSWATDAHKWLNVPYDSGLAFTAHPDSHSASFTARAAYLIFDDDKREQLDWNPEHSRRARLPGLRGDPVTRPSRDRRNDRAHVCPRKDVRCAPRGDGRGGLEQRRAEPGAVPVPRRRAHRSGARRRAGKRGGLDERHGLGRAAGDPHLRLELADDRRRRRADAGRVPRA